jgi:hypothetical protein
MPALKPKITPRLPMWKLEMLREQVERRVRIAREAHLSAQLELHEVLHAIYMRRREGQWSACLDHVENIDVRGFLVPNDDNTEASCGDGPHGS